MPTQRVIAIIVPAMPAPPIAAPPDPMASPWLIEITGHSRGPSQTSNNKPATQQDPPRGQGNDRRTRSVDSGATLI